MAWLRLLLTQVVVGICIGLALLSGTEPAQVLPGCEEILEPLVITHDAVDDTSARSTTHDIYSFHVDMNWLPWPPYVCWPSLSILEL